MHKQRDNCVVAARGNPNRYRWKYRPVNDQAILDQLLSHWQRRKAQGEDVSITDLCRDCPELAPLLERRVRGLQQIDALADTCDARDQPAPGTMPSRAAAEAADPMVGRVLRKYRVLRQLGHGGMGVVYLAEDLRLERQVALKVMKSDCAADPVGRARFLREARAVAAVRHEHIVSVHEADEIDGCVYLVMAYLEGESLEDRLRRPPALAMDAVLRIGSEIAAGLARSVAVPDGVTKSGALLGTPAYMAPEQIDGLNVDARADLFSLGCVLYRTATGRPAFQGATWTALLRAVVDHQPPSPNEVNPAVSAGLSALILRLLAKAPAGRPASAQAVVEELAALGRESSPVAGKQPRPPSPNRRRWWAVAGGLVSLALAAGAAWWFAQPPQEVVPIRPPEKQQVQLPVDGDKPADGAARPLPPVKVSHLQYRGGIQVRVKRQDNGKVQWLELGDPSVLPLRNSDCFKIEAKVEPAAYVYIVWVDPGKDVTPVYPWDPTFKQGDPWTTRPAVEEPVTRVRVPAKAGEYYEAPDAMPGTATMVLLARPTPLDVSDKDVRGWFEALPELPLPPAGPRGVLWFDDYLPVYDDLNRSGKWKLGFANDPFERWQRHLQTAVGKHAAFATAVSFARTAAR